MKKLFITVLFLGFTIFLSAQNTPQVGDELVIKATESSTYEHIDFPKPNILIKRGSVANYKSVVGNTVVIEEVNTKADGTVVVVLKQKDGGKFFNFKKKVTADYNAAIAAKELVAVK
ncbi:hypothetical protein [Winogradskyella pulchriflava]|uniref:Dihydroorotase n=1 Tax=Winogradskyella pulchriflava TaxID=1110688 RepID=A0ABV6Q9K7_9FLAO